MKTNKKQRRLGKRQNHKRRGRALCVETLSDRIMLAADLVSDFVSIGETGKEIPAEVSGELTSGSKSSDTGKSSDAQGKTKPGSAVHALLITPVGLAKKEAADSNKDAGGKDVFPMGEWQPGSKEIPAEVSTELISGSKSSDTGKSSDAQGKTKPGSDVHALLIAPVGLAKKEAADSNKDAGGKDVFPMGEW